MIRTAVATNIAPTVEIDLKSWSRRFISHQPQLSPQTLMPTRAAGQIYESTNQIQRLVMARQLLKG